MNIIGIPLSAENIRKTIEAGRRLRERRAALRAALDGKPLSPNATDAGWFFANVGGEETALACGPFLKTSFA